MKQQLQQRLQQLKAEFESGQQVLADLEEKRTNLQSTLLRIQGAIQVLEEELAKANEDGNSVSTGELETETINAANGVVSREVEVLSASSE